MDTKTHPVIGIALASFNGERYLQEQLTSFRCQSQPPQTIMISDDGSTDETLRIAHDFAADWPEVTVSVIHNTHQGVAKNFARALQAASSETDFLFLSDQDDVWLHDKIKRATELLAKVPAEKPALYGGRTWICDENLSRKFVSKRGATHPGFGHALMQSLAGGNTMALNRAGLLAVQEALAMGPAFTIHDWWIYQIISGVGGHIVFDDQPFVLYRQHGSNTIGDPTNLQAVYTRAQRLMEGRYASWQDVNLSGLRAVRSLLSPDARCKLDVFDQNRKAGIWRRTSMISKAALRREGRIGQISLWLAAIVGKL